MPEPHTEFAEFLNQQSSPDRIDKSSQEILSLTNELETYVHNLQSSYALALSRIADLERQNQVLRKRHRMIFALAQTLIQQLKKS